MLTYNTNSKTGPVCGGRAAWLAIQAEYLEEEGDDDDW